MTITDLQSVDCFQGWALAPERGPRPPLTPRERQIVDSVLGGRTRKEIAFELGLSDATVRVLYSRGMKKLGRAKGNKRKSPP
ncbi:MAG TPA: LuxR C-terminal-related transcriptional regulator [Polyangia bacterium]|jgi:DNA-binding NarL/FixJ family response regulator|nr:LuxR C-terminal-related transcriptional regulator [Polyangia bacterium]